LLLLCSIDERKIESRKQPEQQKQSKRSKAALHQSATASGVGYSGGWDVYDHHPHHNNNASSLISVDPEEENADSRFTTELKILTALIPRVGSVEGGNFLDEALCLFRHSFLFDDLAELLRNDSITDMVERRLLYLAVFEFLEAIGDHPFLRQLLLEERINRKDSPGIRALSLNPESHTSHTSHTKDFFQDRLPSVLSNGEDLFKQTEWFLNMIEKQSDSSSNSHRESFRLCKAVVKVFQKLQYHVDSTEPESETDSKKTWMQVCVENRVTFSDDVLNLHWYEKEFSQIKSSSKGRLTAIGKEIASMMTSLPAGVFLKVAESRSDVMKVLIVGVEDSPYAGGLFT
jgi:baculoviral IAP repeat-containing protein 6